jgi:hypothetical protein
MSRSCLEGSRAIPVACRGLPWGMMQTCISVQLPQSPYEPLCIRLQGLPGCLPWGVMQKYITFTSLVFPVIVLFVVQWCLAGKAGLPAVGRDADLHPGSTILDVCVLQRLPDCLLWGAMRIYIQAPPYLTCVCCSVCPAACCEA